MIGPYDALGKLAKKSKLITKIMKNESNSKPAINCYKATLLGPMQLELFIYFGHFNKRLAYLRTYLAVSNNKIELNNLRIALFNILAPIAVQLTFWYLRQYCTI